MASSLFFRAVWSSGEMFSVSGSAGSDESIVIAEEEGEDSASKRAWRTAESLVDRAGLEEWIVVDILIMSVLVVRKEDDRARQCMNCRGEDIEECLSIEEEPNAS